MKKIVIAAMVLVLSACSTTKPLKEESVRHFTITDGLVDISFSTNGQWNFIKSSATASVPIQNDSGIEQAMNVATMRARKNILELIETKLKYKTTVDSLAAALISSNIEKNIAADISTKVSESIISEANGILKGTYVYERKINEDKNNVMVTVMVSAHSMRLSEQIIDILNNNKK